MVTTNHSYFCLDVITDLPWNVSSPNIELSTITILPPYSAGPLNNISFIRFH